MSQPRTAVARPARPSAALGLVLVIVLTLVAGCGVRLETPPPAAPSPDAQESARQRASADAVALEVLAGPADAPPDPAADPLGAARAAVAADARVHLDALGGLYHPDPATTPPADGDDTRTTTGTSTRTDTGTAADATGASPTPGTAAAPVPEPAPAAPEVLASALTEAAATARADADAVADGPLARLLASIAVNRLLAADRLADASGLAAPPVPPVLVPDAAPEGVAGADLSALVASEDAAGYALEVVAAQHRDDLRRRAGDRAVTHRSRAESWARAAGVAGTGLDPRRVAYTLPSGLGDPAGAAAAVAGLETSLAAHYAGLVASAPAGGRAALVDAVAETTAEAVAWGAALPALPGMPEQDAG